MSHKACYMCKQFDILHASDGYSEYTPGSSFDMWCHKDHWSFDAYECTQQEYAEILETANTCVDYEPADFVEEVENG